MINYHGSKEKAKETAAEITAANGKAELCPCSVSDFAACGEMIQEIVKKYKRIDILVNNAGITRDGLLMKMSEEDFDLVLDTNLKGTFNTIRHASRYFLKQRSGKIINISSVSGILGIIRPAKPELSALPKVRQESLRQEEFMSMQLHLDLSLRT